VRFFISNISDEASFEKKRKKDSAGYSLLRGRRKSAFGCSVLAGP
jgi:hypothetical protein